MPDEKQNKAVSFLPPISTALKPISFFSSKTHQIAPLGFSRYALPTNAEQKELNAKAKKAAMAGLMYLTEQYRKRGACMMAFARDVAISGNLHYAEFLVKNNPQASDLIDELTLGFYAGGHDALAHGFAEKYHSVFFALQERNRVNRYLRPDGLKYKILKNRIDEAISQALAERLRRKPSIEFSSSDESFTLSP